MALKYNRVTVDKVDIKGLMDAECKTITYQDKVDGDIVERTVVIQDYLNQFGESMVQLTLSRKMEEGLDLPDEEIDADELAPDYDFE